MCRVTKQPASRRRFCAPLHQGRPEARSCHKLQPCYFERLPGQHAGSGASRVRSGSRSGRGRCPWRPCASPDLRPGGFGACFGLPFENGAAWRFPARRTSPKDRVSSSMRSAWNKMKPSLRAISASRAASRFSRRARVASSPAILASRLSAPAHATTTTDHSAPPVTCLPQHLARVVDAPGPGPSTPPGRR